MQNKKIIELILLFFYFAFNLNYTTLDIEM